MRVSVIPLGIFRIKLREIPCVSQFQTLILTIPNFFPISNVIAVIKELSKLTLYTDRKSVV